jgi:predicted TIM-barrel fold metal-dependent hydrolase
MEGTPLNRRQALGVLVTGSCAMAAAASAAPAANAFPGPGQEAAAGTPLEKPIIWDTHCHLSGEGRTPEEKLANLIRYADRLGVDRMMVHMGYPIVVDPSPDEIRRQNDQALQAISRYPDRAFGFVYLSGHYPDFSVQELDRCVKDGPMVGVKLWVARRCAGPEFDPIAARAGELKAPVIQHTWMNLLGNGRGESTPQDLADLARRHPQTTFVCVHSGGDWSLGLRAIRSTRNVLAETAGSNPTTGFVEMAVRELGAERVVYGSDVPGRGFASQLAKVLGADIPAAAKRLILGENLRRILTPILQAKGIMP